MVPAGNKAKRLLSVNHTTKTIHYHHHHHHHHHVKLVSNISNMFKMDTKTELHETKIFDKNLVAIPKNKVTLRFIKLAHVVWN